MPGDITGSLVYDAAHRASSPSARARSSPTCCSPTRSTAPRRRPSRRCSRRWRRGRSRSTARRARCRGRSWSPRPRTRSSTRAPTRCPRPSSTGSCSRWCCPLPPREDEVLEICAGTPPASTRATWPRPGVRPVAGAGRPRRPGAARCARCSVSAEVAGYIVDIARATRQSPSLGARRQPARRDRADAHQPRLGLAHGPRLRHPRRRQGARAGDPRPPARRCGPRPSSRASTSAPCSPARARLRAASRGERRPADGTLMALTGRVPLLLLLGLVPVVLRPPVAHRAAVVCWSRWSSSALDVLLAPSPAPARPSTASRSPPVRLGRAERASTLLRGQHRRRAGARGWLRDAWQPSAGATGEPAPAPAPPAASGRRVTTRCARPGAATGRPTGSPCAAWARSAWPAGSARSRSPGASASLPPFDSRKHLPSRLARLRELDGRSAVRVRGQGTEFDSLREYVARRRRPQHRLAGHRPHAAPSWCAPGSPSATGGWSWCSTPRAPRPGGSTTSPAWTPRWTPRCCSPRWRPGPATASTSSPATGGSAPGSVGREPRPTLLGRPGRRDGRRWSRRSPRRTGRRWPARSAALGRQRGAGRAAHPARAVGGRGGPAAGAAGAGPAPPGGAGLGRATPTLERMAGRATALDEVYDAAAAEQTLAAAPAHRRRCSARLGVDVIDADAGATCRVALADHYLLLKSRGLL